MFDRRLCPPHSAATSRSGAFAWGALVLVLALGGGGVARAQQPAASSEPPAAAPAPALAARPVPRFDVLEYVILGNTVLDTETIERAVTPFLGPGRTMTDVESARAALERAYQARGFQSVGVDVPEQRVDDAIVTLQVVEATVGRLRVRGARYYSPGVIAASLPSAAEGTVPQFADVGAEIANANAGAGLVVTPALKPGRTPGTLDIDLDVQDRSPLVASIDLNNQRALNTTPWRLGLGLRHTNLFERRHTLGVGVMVTPADTDQVKVFTASYAMPLGGMQDPVLSAYAIKSDSETPTPIGNTTVLGGQTVVGLRMTTPLRVHNDLFHTWSVGLDYKRLDQQDFPRLSYMPASLGYTALRSVQGAVSQLETSVAMSFAGLVNEQEAFAARRYLGSASFATVRWDASHEQPIGAGLSVRGRFAGQYAQQALVPAEQFASGGANSVRGYLESSVFGDRGLLGSLELRTRPQALYSAVTAQWLAFYDVSQVSIVDPLPEQRSVYTLAGAGAGLRLRWGRSASAAIDIARSIHEAPSQDTGWRAHVRLQLEL
jgi:hemolysin activation/secretion protein